MPKTAGIWTPKIKKNSGPLYIAIANAIAEDIAIGQLAAEQRLPPQRKLAEALGIDFTTVARAYTEAHRRGLIDSVVGRGTFVCGKRRPRIPRVFEGRPTVDMSMNMAPEPDAPDLLALMQNGYAEVGNSMRDLLRYQNFGGSHEDREAGALWLRRRGMVVDHDRLLVVPGAQCGLLAILTTIAPAGSVICCEELTYPGLRALAGLLGIKLVGLPMDAEGIDAVAFAGACAQYGPKALYCNPTLLNPTTGTISAARRQALVDVARHYDVPIIEDDAYGFLPRSGPPAMASLAPDITFYVAGLAKCVGAGLRIAYMVAPDAHLASRLASSLRATTVMASPVTSTLATRWVRDGTADLMLNAIRKESAARQKLAARILPPGSYQSKPDAFHLWINLPPAWEQKAFAAHLAESGVGVVPSDAFCVSGPPPAAVRVCIGGLANRDDIQHGLEMIAQALRSTPKVAPAVV
ncbi:aminotransferase-like domain-containing protein [Oxalicibacterium faecigallinarum]|uniref:GntR family transcriptional regulator n=1 Tax=Oxalicibacterium faecigallinarum TaxID=573741 RepID=A0A8J3AQE0_9BURK|nr:PLP-dependent aminotransferase family protein [Oxalicibacterium faecigallinarum]GGI19616.1 GntR family transcriptional regulator [Oxalicibacterium faecigallinarum]